MSIKVRFPPSPTGNLHVGTVRTLLYSWLWARKNGGKVIFRIEDTDRERSTKEYEDNIIEGLTWLGLDWDGDIYRQTERGDIYRKYLGELLENKKAFYCYHTKEELEIERNAQMEAKEPPRHICSHKYDSPENKDGGIIRLNVDEKSDRVIVFEDKVKGEIKWTQNLLGDFSIAKDLDNPLYNFAVAIDDMDMGISHVIRGEDHISNTPKQILVYEALNKPIPIFAHVPLILGSDKSKLSKRHGATAVTDYKKDYLPESLVNFLGFLGYTFSKDIISISEMVSEFELDKIHSSPAIFDVQKLNWINSQYVRNLPVGELKKKIGHEEISDFAASLIGERLEKFSDAQVFSYLWERPKYDKELLVWKKSDLEGAINSLKTLLNVLGDIDMNESDIMRGRLDAISEDRGSVYWPLRVALSGAKMSPDPIDLAKALGSQEVIARIKIAINK